MAKNNLKADWFLTCEYASVSGDNKLSISGIFDEIKLSGLPVNLPRYFIVGVFSGVPKSAHNVYLKVYSPTGKVLVELGGMTVVLGTNGKVNYSVDVANMPITEAGKYTVLLSDGGREIVRREISCIYTGNTDLNLN